MVVSRSSVEAEYRVMTHTACEMMWLKNLLESLVFVRTDQAAIYIASNPVFHKRANILRWIVILFVMQLLES